MTDVQGSSGYFSVRHSFQCTSSDVIYCISCCKCPNLLYIGETSQLLAERFRSHLSDIRTNKNTEVAIHFNSNGHSIDDIVVCGLLYECDKNVRRCKETRLIQRLGTLTPGGLNAEEDSRWHR